MLSPILQHILCPKNPTIPLGRILVAFLDPNPFTTYTFIEATVGDIGRFTAGTGRFGTHENTLADTPLAASPSSRAFYIIVGGTDALTTFNVSSVTWGGVAGTELVDRGGATNAVNSAIYGWSDTALLAATAPFDIAVTWSEPISLCGITVVEIRNLRSFGAVATGTATGTAAMDVDVTGIADNERVAGGGIVLFGSICAANTTAPDVSFTSAGAGPMDAFFPQMLALSASTASQFAGYFQIPSTNGHGGASILNFTVDWPGTPAGDVAAIYIA